MQIVVLLQILLILKYIKFSTNNRKFCIKIANDKITKKQELAPLHFDDELDNSNEEMEHVEIGSIANLFA